MKNIKSLAIFIALLLLPLISKAEDSSSSIGSLVRPVKYGAITKINVFTYSDAGWLEAVGSGSGIILDSSGKMLTNYHVIAVDDFDKKLKPTAYQICLTEDSNKEPDCLWSADYIASDKNYDLALLQIRKLENLSPDVEFQSVNLSQQSVKTGDKIRAIGYPGIGGKTITLTQGIVSGTEDKGDKHWIKTDAVVSFGNSGGAAINDSGEVVGVTARGNSDQIASLGYLIDGQTVSKWLADKMNLNPKNAGIPLDRIMNFSYKQAKLKDWQKFINYNPDFEITRQPGWKFEFIEESSLSIIKENEDDDAGRIEISLVGNAFGYNNSKSLEILAKTTEIDSAKILPMKDKGEQKIANVIARRMAISVGGLDLSTFLVPVGKDLMTIVPFAGAEAKDKTAIEAMLKSIKFGKNNIVIKSVSQQTNVGFQVKLPKEFNLLEQSSREQPVIVYSQKYPEARLSLYFEYIDDGVAWNSKEYVSKAKEIATETNGDVEVKVVEVKEQHKLSGGFNNAIRLVTTSQKKGDKNISYSITYTKKLNNNYLAKSKLDYYGSKDGLKKTETEFLKVFAGISFK